MYLFDPDNWEWLWSANNLEFLLEAFLINLEIALISMVLSLIFGLGLALMAISRLTPLRLATKTWVDVFRNLPVILLMLYFFLTLPQGLKEWWTDSSPDFLPDALQSPAVLAAVISLTLYNSAVLAEIMRAGILSLDRGQREAASALGLTYRQSMRFVILPQGLRRMVPATVSQLITLNKDTTLASIIAIQEVVRSGRIVSNTAGNPFVAPGPEAPILQVMILVGILFIIVNLALSRLSQRLEIREGRRTATTTEGPRVTGVEDQLAV